MKKSLLIFLLLSLSVVSARLSAQNEVIKVVVLGSSTAAGTGPVNSSNAWVNLYRTHLKELNTSNEVINLAVGGYSTYQVMPSSFTAPADRPAPDASHNITKALSLSPDVIIINLPTNDAASGYTKTEQMFNYSVMLDSAAAKNIPVYVATTQPRNLSTELKQNLMDMRDSINKYLGDKAIDFWTDIAAADGTIATAYDMGDGVHLNDAAHILLASRVEAEDILSHSVDIADYDTVNIDLGSNLTPGNWNNMTLYTAGSAAVNLINSSGETTAFTSYVHDSFTGINTTGTTTPDASIDFPSTATSDSFFGSAVAFNGVTEATGGITIDGLAVDKKYSFTIFASRTGVSDNRETQYVVTGSTTETVYLDASNNIANSVTTMGIVPAADGTISIAASPGPNNTNSSKFYFFGSVKMVYEKVIVYDSDGIIKIDLGNASNMTSGNYNNLTSFAGGETISDLINFEGNHTGFSIYVSDAFGGLNDYGTSTPDESLELEPTATADSFFGNTVSFYSALEPTGGLTLTGLDVTTSYTFRFFASRPEATDNRETTYTVNGKTSGSASLNSSNNTTEVAIVENIVPSDDGTIVISVTPGANNTNAYKFFYLGALTITYGDFVVHDDNGTINIDLGDPTTTTAGWNNFTDATGASSISDLKNNADHSTGISLSVHDAFTGINTTGTTAPDASLGWASSVTSDSFFGNVGSHNGIFEPTAGVTFSGLDINTKYTFTLFASRAGVTDNREAQYLVTGSSDTTLYLDASNNTVNVVSATDIIPAADGTIRIDITPGTNNTNSLKYFYLGSVVIDYMKIVEQVEYDADGSISIDYGSAAVTSAGTWNNLTAPRGGQNLMLKNDEGNETGITASVHDAFTDSNLTGTTTPDASLNLISSATSDSFFGNSGAHESIVEPTGGLTFSGLNADSYYTFTIFASRDGVSDNREAKYIITGESDTTVYLDAANNVANVVCALNMKPTAEGKITIDASPGSNNTNALGYFYLGVVRIDYGNSPLTDIDDMPEEKANKAQMSIYPNPATENTTIAYYVPQTGKVQIRIFNISGQQVATVLNAEQPEGYYHAEINKSDSDIFSRSGLYFCQVKITSKNKIYMVTQKLLIVN